MPGKNKYVTFAFIVLFALSGTGLPMIVHLCNTMNEMSFESCGMCANEIISENPVFSRTDDCCNSTQLTASITDQYIVTKSDQDIQLFAMAVLPFTIQLEEPQVTYTTIYSGVSPPETSDLSLYLINSSFLI